MSLRLSWKTPENMRMMKRLIVAVVILVVIVVMALRGCPRGFRGHPLRNVNKVDSPTHSPCAMIDDLFISIAKSYTHEYDTANT